MDLPRPTTSHRRAMAALAIALLIALPSAAAMEAAGEELAREAREAEVLTRLDGIIAQPEVLEYMPPAPWAVDTIEEYGPTYGYEPVNHNDLIMSAGPTATTGTAKVIALAIEFTDVTHRSSSTIASIDGVLDGSNSMRNYYEEVSNDKLTIDGAAAGWYTAENDMAHYGAPYGGSADSQYFKNLIKEAVRAADKDVDFSDYDVDHDGFIDYIVLVHAGQDEAAGGGSNAIWSKQTHIDTYLRVDGVYVGYYLTVSEFSPMGVYAHEFGHMLGLPDLYDVDYSSTGVGVWDIMASGAWNNWGRSPAHFSAWCKVQLGWVEPTVVSQFVEGRQLPMVEGSGCEIIKLPTSNSREYFLLENRYKTGYDSYLPGSGLLIWHIDSYVISRKLSWNQVNTDEEHKGVDLEEASGTQDLDQRTGNDGDRYDLWTNNLQGWGPDSTPNSDLYDGTRTEIRVFNISGPGTIMTLDIDFGGDSYAVFMDTLSTQLEAGPGQTVQYNVTVGTRSTLGDTLSLEVKGSQSSWATIKGGISQLVLGSKGATVVRLQVTPPAGTASGTVGEVVLKASSQTAGGMYAEVRTSTVVKQVHALAATPMGPTVVVVPSQDRHLDFNITNTGNGPENLTFMLDSSRPYWGSVHPEELTVDVGETAKVQVTFHVSEGTLAGQVENWSLVLLSEVEGGGFEGGEKTSLVPTLEVPITMVVGERISLRWGSIQPREVLPGFSLDYELTLYNEGNSEVDVLLGFQGPEGWTLEFTDGDSVTIPAFQAVTINATLSAPEGVAAGSTARLDLSAMKEVPFFTSFDVDVLQLYALEVEGQEARFADPGETAVYNVTVANLGNGNDRVTIEAYANGGTWQVTVDENFVDLGTGDGQRSRDFHVRVTPPADASAYEEREFTIRLFSENEELTGTHAVACTVNPVTSFHIETEVLQDNIDPSNGDKLRAVYLVHITNRGNLEDLFHIGIQGLEEGWSSFFESRMVSVPANKRKTVEFSVQAPSGDLPTLADDYQFAVTVASELGTGRPASADLTATVRAHRGHSLSTLEPSYTGPSGSRLTFRVLVVNEGNVAERVTLSAVGSYESVSFETIVLDLEPFGQRVVNVTVELPHSTDDASVDLQVIATSPSNAEQLPVPIGVQGRTGAPGMGAVTALLAVALVAAVGVAVGSRGRRRR